MALCAILWLFQIKHQLVAPQHHAVVGILQCGIILIPDSQRKNTKPSHSNSQNTAANTPLFPENSLAIPATMGSKSIWSVQLVKRKDISDNTPPSHDPLGPKRRWYELYVQPLVERNRAFILVVLLICIATLQAGTIFMLFPLHKAVPWIVRVNANTGAIVGQPTPVTEAAPPTNLEVQYFMARWVRDVMTLNPVLTVSYLSRAYGFTMGTGTQELKNYISQKQPIVKLQTTPGLVSTVRVDSTNFLSGNNAFLRVTEAVQTNGQTVYKHYDVTISYVLIPPTTLQQAYKNPIGFHVTEFTITKSLSDVDQKG